jgi:hypothetical protein
VAKQLRDVLERNVVEEKIDGKGIAEAMRMSALDAGEFEDSVERPLPARAGASRVPTPVQKKCSGSMLCAVCSRSTTNGGSGTNTGTRVFRCM